MKKLILVRISGILFVMSTTLMLSSCSWLASTLLPKLSGSASNGVTISPKIGDNSEKYEVAGKKNTQKVKTNSGIITTDVDKLINAEKAVMAEQQTNVEGMRDIINHNNQTPKWVIITGFLVSLYSILVTIFAVIWRFSNVPIWVMKKRYKYEDEVNELRNNKNEK